MGAEEIDFTASRDFVCASQKTALTASLDDLLRLPGGNCPMRYPIVETMFGSLMVHQRATSLPRNWATFAL